MIHTQVAIAPQAWITEMETPLSDSKVLVFRVGQNRIYTPYMTVCMVISLPKIP